MSTTTNEKQPFYGPAQESSVDNFGASLNYPAASCHSFELSPSEVTVDNFGASLNYHATSCYSFANTTEAVLYDNGETFNILNSEDDVRAGQTALLSTEFNHADIPNWNYNSTGDIASTSLDPVTNFQNFTSFEQNTASSNDGYLQGLLDGIDMGINFNWQEMNVLALAPTEQGFISGEIDANTALIGQQATPPAPVIGPFANHVAPAPRFACDSIGCGKTFGRQSDCNRHMKKHGAPEYSCPALGCGREFYRRDKVMDHARRIHQLQL